MSEPTKEYLMDIPVKLYFDLGKAKVKVRTILNLKEGDVVETAKNAGEYVDINVENQALGKGETIILDNKFAIRITSICTKQ